MSYRDPTLSQMAAELQEEKTKTAILEEEVRELRALLKREVEDEPEIPEPPVKLGFFRNISCRWLGNHTHQITVDEESALRALNGEQKGLFNRTTFCRFCRITCFHCGSVYKEFNEPMKSGMALAEYFNVIGAFNEVFEDFVRKHSAT